MDIPGMLKHLETLVSPNQTENKTLEQVFVDKCLLFTSTSTELVNSFEETAALTSPFVDESWWKFHSLVLEHMLKLKKLLAVADEKGKLLSVQQQKILKAALEIVVVFGIVNHLPKGIGIPLKQRSSLLLLRTGVFAEATPSQKCYSLFLTVRCLMDLRNDDTFKSFIGKQHLGDVFAAMFALLFPPVEGISECCHEAFTVPDSVRASVKLYLGTLIENEFQPNVVRELMLLNGNPDCPPRARRVFRSLLTDRLMQRVGVVATIKAILDLTQGLSSPQHWKTVNTLSRLITTPHLSKREGSYEAVVYPQIHQLLHANEVEYMQVAVSCVRQLLEKDVEVFNEWFSNKLTRPLLVPSSEDDISQCIEVLHNCCGIPCSENWALPMSALGEVHVNLFRLHCKTHLSIYHLKSKIDDLVSAIVEQCSPDYVIDMLLFKKGSVVFLFGENGGVKTESGEEEPDLDVAPDLLLEAIMARESTELKYKYFEAALNTITVNDFEKKLVAAKLLSELASDDSVQGNVNKNPNAVIKFLGELLKSEEDVEVACVGLMVISAMLDDPRYKETRDWKAFQTLVQPLKKFQTNATNVEVRVLAEQLHNTILSHGVVTSTKQKGKSVQLKNNVDEAMKEAVDTLLPVRAHGLMSLARLIAKKDRDTYAKRDMLLCLFKENLKEEDSYVYLAAVEGLSVLAAEYPDEVLTTLTEEYRTAVKTPEVRLKIGETLIKLVRLLNEMAVVYKGELIGAYLQGCLDNDHLVRASSLSNLGELCKILSFRIHAYLVDLFQLLRNVVATDKSPEPRRAAVMVITLLLQGLGKDTFSTLQDLVLELYRALKTIVRCDNDDVTKLHAELALQELNSCTVNLLMPSQKMEKRIYVMDPLP